MHGNLNGNDQKVCKSSIIKKLIQKKKGNRIWKNRINR